MTHEVNFDAGKGWAQSLDCPGETLGKGLHSKGLRAGWGVGRVGADLTSHLVPGRPKTSMGHSGDSTSPACVGHTGLGTWTEQEGEQWQTRLDSTCRAHVSCQGAWAFILRVMRNRWMCGEMGVITFSFSHISLLCQWKKLNSNQLRQNENLIGFHNQTTGQTVGPPGPLEPETWRSLSHLHTCTSYMPASSTYWPSWLQCLTSLRFLTKMRGKRECRSLVKRPLKSAT